VSIQERMVTLPAIGVTTRVLEAGGGAVVLLLGGNPDNGEEGGPVMRRGGPTPPRIAPGIPGSCKSAGPPAGVGFFLKGRVPVVDALLAVLGVSARVLVVVHDVGGMMGIAWAGARTDRLSGLLITNTVAFDDFEWFAIARTWGRESAFGRLRAKAGLFLLSLA